MPAYSGSTVEQSSSKLSDSEVYRLMSWAKKYSAASDVLKSSPICENDSPVAFYEPKLEPSFRREAVTFASLSENIKKRIQDAEVDVRITEEERLSRLAMLKRLSKWKDYNSTIEEISIAIQLYQQYINFKYKFDLATTKIKSISFLTIEFQILDKITADFAVYRNHVMNLRFGIAEYHAKIIKKNIQSAENIVLRIPGYLRFKVSTLQSYRDITKSKVRDSDDPCIIQAMQLFKDYYEKNSIFYFHWRKHNKPAMKIVSKLNELSRSEHTKSTKIQLAINIIKESYKDVGDEFGYVKSSSFIRRSRFALDLLDNALKTSSLSQSVQVTPTALCL